MGDQRNEDQEGTTGEEGWRDDAAPTSPSDLDIDSDRDEDDLEGDEDIDERLGGEDDTESGAGYGNNNEVPPNPD